MERAVVERVTLRTRCMVVSPLSTMAVFHERDVINKDNASIVVPATLAGTRSGGPWTIRTPLEKLRAKFLGFGRARYHSLDFELYSAQRAASCNWTHRIEGADLHATLLMNSGVRGAEIDRLMAKSRDIESALVEVPNVGLGDTDPKEWQEPLKRLFASIRAPRFSLARATKLLCMKRPGLIPMLDREVLVALCGRAPTSSAEPGVFASQAVELVLRFRSLMLSPAGGGTLNYAVLQSVASSLTEAVAAHLETMGIEPPHPQLSPVRVLDNLLWFDWYGHGYFGYRWNQATQVVEPDSQSHP